MERQHQGMDRPGVRQVPEGSGEQGKLKKMVVKKKNDDPRSKGIVNDELPVYNSDLVTCVQ